MYSQKVKKVTLGSRRTRDRANRRFPKGIKTLRCRKWLDADNGPKMSSMVNAVSK